MSETSRGSVASPEPTVKLPTNRVEAELMAKLGLMWLAQNGAGVASKPAPGGESTPSSVHSTASDSGAVQRPVGDVLADFAEYLATDSTDMPARPLTPYEAVLALLVWGGHVEKSKVAQAMEIVAAVEWKEPSIARLLPVTPSTASGLKL